ncbi:hypothetical protein V8B97DRAFT_1437204 [Scleroderma yunnanense]
MSLKQPYGSFHVSHDAEIERNILPTRSCSSPGSVHFRTPRRHPCFHSIMLNLRRWVLLRLTALLQCRSRRFDHLARLCPSSSRRGSRRLHILLTHIVDHASALPELARASRSLAHDRLIWWLLQMKGGEIELGGFCGRTNKLVDGCYSWLKNCEQMDQTVDVSPNSIQCD